MTMENGLDFRLASFAANLRYKDLPPRTVEAARRNLFDTIATGVGGSAEAGISMLVDQANAEGGAAQASVWVHGRKVPARTAALINGTMAHALDFDDTHDEAVLHAGVTVVPAALAVAEMQGNVSGKELVTAIAAGIEVVCRLGRVTGPWIGWILTSVYGYFGAATAAGRILGLTPEQMLHAWGIAYAQSAGNVECIASGSLAKRLQAGLASQGGVFAAQLAARSFTGATRPFTGQNGVFNLYQRGDWKPEGFLDGLGERFEVEALSYKPYPCCRWTHTAIDAALDLNRSGIDLSQVAAVGLHVGPEAFGLCEPAAVKHRPRTPVDGQFSIPYTAVAGLVRGRVGIAEFDASALADADILSMLGRTTSKIDAAIAKRGGRGISPTRIVVDMKDGSRREATAAVPKGDPRNPMTDEEMQAKFADCLRHGTGRRPGDAAALLSLLGGVQALSDISVLASALSRLRTQASEDLGDKRAVAM